MPVQCPESHEISVPFIAAAQRLCAFRSWLSSEDRLLDLS
jgi:hypothetical protein